MKLLVLSIFFLILVLGLGADASAFSFDFDAAIGLHSSENMFCTINLRPMAKVKAELFKDLDELSFIIKTSERNRFDSFHIKPYTDGWGTVRTSVIPAFDRRKEGLVQTFSQVPEPATLMLFGIGLMGMAILGRKHIRRHNWGKRHPLDRVLST